MPTQSLRCLRSGVVVDLLLHHGSVDIIRTEAQRDLRHPRCHHLPIALDVREVVQQQPAHRNLPDIRHAARHGKMSQRRVVRMKAQRNEGLESASLILHLAQLQQVIHTVFIVLDMPIEHRRIRSQASFVQQSRRIEPFAAVDLVVADDVTHAVGEDLRPAARTRIHTRSLHAFDSLGN